MGHTNMMKVLLDGGADVHYPLPQASAPIDFAAAK